MKESVRSPVQAAIAILKARGVALTVLPGEYAVGWRSGLITDAYRTGDLFEAVAYGLALGDAPLEPPPLGPMGTGKGRRRGLMYAHNRRIASRRRSDGIKALKPDGAARSIGVSHDAPA